MINDNEVDVLSSIQILLEGLDRGYDAVAVFDTMRRSAKGETTMALIRGEYDRAGFGDNRSLAESRLVDELGYWFGDDRELVWALIDYVSRLCPLTDTGDPRKWIEQGERYRQNLFDYRWFGQRRTYTPHLTSATDEPRRDISWVTKARVLEVVHDIGVATCKDIVVHPLVDVKERQVSKYLKELSSEGLVELKRAGNTVYYYPSGRDDLLRARVGS